MCPKCKHMFCTSCQKAYCSIPANVDCSICRQSVEKEEMFKPLNKKLRKKMSKLLFDCAGCPSLLTVNDRGVLLGEHKESCQQLVSVNCQCGKNFNSRFAQAVKDIRQHLVEQCPTIISANARKLMRVNIRFEDMGVPKPLIDFYNKQDPFYFLSPQD